VSAARGGPLAANVGLRAFNGASTLLWGLAQSYVFVRALGVDEFGRLILVGALAAYLVAADLGASRVIYVALRRPHLDGALGEARHEAAFALAAYAALAVVGTAAFAAVVGEADLTLWFLFAALHLPWAMARAVAGATDRWLAFEAVDALRRAGLFAAALALLWGVSFRAFGLLLLLLWAAAFAVVLRRLRGVLAGADLGRGARRFLGQRLPELRDTALYSTAEFVSYTFPFLLIPAVWGAGAPLVLFDTYYKVVRLGVAAFRVGGDGLLPRQTAAWHAGDRAALARATALVLGLGLGAALVLSALLLAAGDAIFAALLGRADLVPREAVWAMAATLVALAAQSTAGSLLSHLGFFAPLARVALAVLAAMALLAAAAPLLAGPGDFLLGYAAIYVCGAAAFVALAWRQLA